MTKKLFIPIEIKSEKDLPEYDGLYLTDKGYFKFKNNKFINDQGKYLIYIYPRPKFWYKEISEEEYLKEKCTKFFYWWYNEPDNNTEQGFDEWYKKIK